MGRRHRIGRIPQNDRREAQREVRRCKNVAFPPRFGVRRELEVSMSEAILSRMQILKDQEDIPQGVELRPSLHVSLLPQRAFGKQIIKGLAAGYNLGKVNSRLTNGDHGSVEAEAWRKKLKFLKDD